MLTDAPPRDASRAGFLESDRIRTLDLPQDRRLLPIAKSIESIMQTGKTADVRRPCVEFLTEVSDFYKASICGVRVLAARPLRVREHWTTELFGDYHIETTLIRLWMRTAIRKLPAQSGSQAGAPSRFGTGLIHVSSLNLQNIFGEKAYFTTPVSLPP
jgi:hypothetical protein